MRTKEEIEAYLQKLNVRYDEILGRLQRLKIRDDDDRKELQRLFSEMGEIAVIRGTLKWVLDEVVE